MSIYNRLINEEDDEKKNLTPSQRAREDQKTKTDSIYSRLSSAPVKKTQKREPEKKPSWFEKVKTKVTDFFTSKKKTEIRLDRIERPEINIDESRQINESDIILSSAKIKKELEDRSLGIRQKATEIVSSYYGKKGLVAKITGGQTSPEAIDFQVEKTLSGGALSNELSAMSKEDRKTIQQLILEEKNNSESIKIYSEIANKTYNDRKFIDGVKEGAKESVGKGLLDTTALLDKKILGYDEKKMLWNVSQKQKNGQLLTPQEEALYKNEQAKSYMDAVSDKSFGYVVGYSLAQMPKFGIEMYLTSPLRAGPSTVLKGAKIFQQLATKSVIAEKIARGLITTIPQTAGFLPKIIDQAGQYVLGDPELTMVDGEPMLKYLESKEKESFSEVVESQLPKAFVAQYIEVAGESFGEVIDYAGGELIKKFLIKKGINITNKVPKGTWQKILDKTNLNSILGEWAEELVQGSSTELLEEGEITGPFSTPEKRMEQLATLLTIGIYGGVVRIPSAIQNAKADIEIKKIQKVADSAGLDINIKEEIEKLKEEKPVEEKVEPTGDETIGVLEKAEEIIPEVTEEKEAKPLEPVKQTKKEEVVVEPKKEKIEAKEEVVTPMKATDRELANIATKITAGKGEFKTGELYEQELPTGTRQVLVSGTDEQGNVDGWYLPSKEASQLGQGGFAPARFKKEELQIPQKFDEKGLREAMEEMFAEKPKEEVKEPEVVEVDKARLESSTYSQETNRQVGGGDIDNSYSGDRIVEGKTRKPFELNGKKYVSVGGIVGGDVKAVELVPIAEYKGKIGTYSDPPQEHSYEGMKVTHRGKEYVLSNPITVKAKADKADKVDLAEPLPKDVKIKKDETTTIRSKRVPDISEVPETTDRGRNTEIDERTLHDETPVPSESGTGSKRDRGKGYRVGKVSRIDANNKAISILETNNYSTTASSYTAQEKEQLAEYTGAGGKEVAGATGKGLLSEYYTPPEVTEKVWEIVNEFAADAETLLEPSVGIGSLLKGRPKYRIVDAYEYQKVSGTIAKILNQDIFVRIGNGEEFGNEGNFETHKADQSVDLVVGNPPFGERASFLKGKGEEPKINRWEEYFIKKGLDSLKDGGTLVYIVNSSFLDKGTSYGKEQIAKIGRLVQAFKLPEGIFADTSIGTDIVVFEKTKIFPNQYNENLAMLANGNYFGTNTDNVMGTLKSRKNRFGKYENYVEGTVEDIKRINPTVEKEETKEVDVPADVSEPRNNKYFVTKWKGDKANFVEIKAKSVEVKGIKDAFVHKTIGEGLGKWTVSEGKTGGSIGYGETQNEAVEKVRATVKRVGNERVQSSIDNMIKKNGVSPRYTGKKVTIKPKVTKDVSYAVKVNRKIKGAGEKKKLPAIIEPDKKKVQVVPRQTVSGGIPISNPIELMILKNTKIDGSVDYIESAKRYLNFHKGKYYHDVNYYSGDIYQKIEDLRNDKEEILKTSGGQAQYDKQMKKLEEIKPRPVTIDEISFDPLDRYITQVEIGEREGEYAPAPTLINRFINFIDNSDTALSYGVNRYDIRNYVSGRRLSRGKKNVRGAIKADSKRLFNYFIQNVVETDVQDQIIKKFNREKNSYVNPNYSKLPTEIADMAKYFKKKTFSLSRTQANGVSFLTNKGVGLVAYGVGVGKTHTMLTATMVAKQRGWTKKPAFIVPKSTLTNTWVGTVKAMFPNETIVNLGGLTKPDIKKLEKARGKDPKKWIKDGEVAVVTHEGLMKLSLSQEELVGAMKDLTDALMSEPKTARAGEKAKEKLVEIIGKAQSRAGNIKISDLGIDHISVDEVHNFRKIFQGAKPEALNPDGTVDRSKVKRFGNVVGGTPSKRAQQLFLISQHILKNNNNRGVYLASATPFENHATEVYNILSLVARDRMKKIGIFNINDFFALFSNFETEMDKNARGEWVNKEKMKSFKNLPQLQKLLREFVDYQVDPTLVRPERRVLTPQLQMSALQEENLEKIQVMLAPVDGTKPEEGAVLKASTYSVANSISPYFIKEWQPKIVTPEELIDNSPKLKYSMELIKHLREDEARNKYGTFLYIGSNGVNYHNHLTNYAVNHLGFKAKEVAVINGSTKNDEREAIKKDFNSGVVKLLIGGDPTKEGIDLQNNGYVTINVALGWNPTEPNQVEGRVWRQGNSRSIAPLVYPLVENSGDITVYGKFEEKGGRINDLFSYRGQIFDVGELDPKEKKLALMTNPEDKASIEIEMDKAELQNNLMVLSTDIANIKRLRNEKEKAEEDVSYNEKRIKTGKTDWGTTLNKENLAEYRKKLNKDRRKLEGIEAQLERKEIKDIPADIARLETEMEKVNIEIGKITETYENRLAKFQKEYNQMIANRKSINDQLVEFDDKTKDLVEYTEKQIKSQKAKLEEEYEAKYKVPSGNADVGGYADIDLSGVTVDRLRGIQFPELTAMVREITGDVPKLKAFKVSLGKMYEEGEGKIKLSPDIFDDPVVATKMLAHEIGHIADYIPDHITTRGNLIGHIASLNRFMKGKYGELVNREVKTELKNLTQLWKPFDEGINKNFTQYRYSAKELYADAVSVLLNDPALLQKIAPKFYNGFFEHLDTKESFKQSYFDTLDLLNQGEEFVNNKRLEAIYEGFAEGKAKREAIEKQKKPRKSFIERLMRNHVVKADPILRKLKKVNVGVVESEYQKVREKLEEYQMRRNDIKIFLDRVTTEITDALTAIGMNEEDLGVVLKLEREAMGDRMNLANPGGLIGDIPEVVLTHFYEKKNLTSEQIKVFEQIKSRFHDMIFTETERAVRNGNISQEIFDNKIEPNKDTYATFGVVNYIHSNYISAGIKKQTGTLSRIENPFISSILKTTALIEWNNVQEAKDIVAKELLQYFPDDISKAKATRTTKGRVISFRKETDREVLKMMEDGKQVGYNVDPYIKSFFDSNYLTGDEKHLIVNASNLYNSLFKRIVTTWNIAFATFSNPVKDIKRTYVNLGAALNKFAPNKKGLKIVELLLEFVKAIPTADKISRGKMNDAVKEMMKDKAISNLWIQYDPKANNQSDIAFLLRKYKVLGTKQDKTSLVKKAWNLSFGNMLKVIEYVGGVFEASTKVAGYQIASKRIKDGKRLGFITRNYVGTPNYMDGGAWKQVDNSVFVFSNVMLQATRTSVELATDPKTASGYWFRTFMVTFLPKILMSMGLAGWFGEWVRKNYERQTEYDKANYTTIPVGFAENGDAAYGRLPGDQTDGLLGGITFKILSAIIQKKKLDTTGLLAPLVSWVPDVTPVWKQVGDWLGFLQGKNPYDSYRGRLAVDETSWKAGGLIRLNKMVQYSINQNGLGSFKTYDSNSRSTTEAIIQKLPVVNRIIKFSSYGLQERYKSNTDADGARKIIEKRELVDKYIKLAKGMEEGEDLQNLKNKMVNEYFGELPTQGDDLSEAKRLVKKFNVDRVRGSSPYMDKLIKSGTNAEKLDYLSQFHKDMRKDDFKELINSAWEYKIISDTVMDSFKEKIKKEEVVPEEKKSLLNFKIVKEAFAAEGLEDIKNKILITKEKKKGIFAWLKNIFSLKGTHFVKIGDEFIDVDTIDLKKAERLFSVLKTDDPEWYEDNIGERVEKRLFKKTIGTIKGESVELTPTAKPIKEKPTPTAILSSESSGKVYRNPKAETAIKPNQENVNVITRQASKDKVLKDLAVDIAFAESSLDHTRRAEDHGFDGKHYDKNGKLIPYSSAAGLFMFTNATWTEAKRRGIIAKDADKLDKEANTKAAMWYISHGYLGKWKASKGKWGKYYTEEELEPFYKK